MKSYAPLTFFNFLCVKCVSIVGKQRKGDFKTVWEKASPQTRFTRTTKSSKSWYVNIYNYNYWLHFHTTRHFRRSEAINEFKQDMSIAPLHCHHRSTFPSPLHPNLICSVFSRLTMWYWWNVYNVWRMLLCYCIAKPVPFLGRCLRVFVELVRFELGVKEWRYEGMVDGVSGNDEWR